jgi:hypothetical protein
MSGRKSSGGGVMVAHDRTVATLFASLVEALAARDGAELAGGRGFGSGTLQVRGRIFAMASGGRVILKLPAARVSELISSGAGVAFHARRGWPMREWIALSGGPETPSLELAREALAFVRGDSDE